MNWIIDTGEEVIIRERKFKIRSFISGIFMVVPVGDAVASLDGAAVISVR
jgi:hypothetical protein